MKTIKSILEEINQVVKDGQVQAPDWWIDRAMELSALWQELKDKKNESEIAYKKEMSDLVEAGKKIGQAKLFVEGNSENYKMYLYLESRDKTIDDFIMLAKKRAQIENHYG